MSACRNPNSGFKRENDNGKDDPPKGKVQRATRTALRHLYGLKEAFGRHRGRASIGRGVGSKFNAHNGWIRGKNVAIVRKRMIVQTWRGADWKKADLDSILILTFAKAPGGARLTLVHANVPDRKSPSINKGWHTHYWNRWKAYLKRTS